MTDTALLIATSALLSALATHAATLPPTPNAPPPGPPRRLADHPAVAVQRLAARQGYDHASKFYPHPAWLYLLPAPPDTTAVAAADR